MVITTNTETLPNSLAEFMDWNPEDGYKYEWNDGELIQLEGMNKNQVYIYEVLNNLFIRKGYWETGTLVAEYDVALTGIQIRRPDIAYLTKEQIQLGKNGEDVIPEFVIEIVSSSDNIYKVENKVTEYFRAGVKVVWHIFPAHQMVYVYTSRKNVQICIENDICSASPVLPDYEIKISDIFA
jgi:Uma2 family endonuclease